MQAKTLGWKRAAVRLAVVLLALTMAVPALAKSPVVTGLQVSENAGKLKVLVSSTDEVQYKIVTVNDNPNQLVVEVFPAQLATDVKKTLSVSKGIVKDVRVGQFSDNPDIVRVVLDCSAPNPKYVIVRNPNGKGLTLSVVDANYAAAEAPKAMANLDTPEKTTPPAAPAASTSTKTKLVVAYQPIPKKKVIHTAPVRKVSLDFVNADLIYVLKILAKEMDKNLVTDNTVKGSVTMTLKDIPAEGALKLILKLSGFEYKYLGDGNNTILVGSADTVSKTPNDILNTAPTAGPTVHHSHQPITQLVIPLEFAKAGDVMSTIQSQFPDVQATQVPGQNMVMVKGHKDDVLAAKSLASGLDRPPPPPPPAPEVQVVHVNYGDASALLQILKPMFSDISFNLDTRLNAFIVSGNPESIQALRDMLAKIDLPLRQIMLELKVVDLTEQGSKALGFTHGTGGTNGVFTTTLSEIPNVSLTAVPAGAVQTLTNNDFNPNFFVRTPFVITSTLNMLISQNDAVVVAQPRLVTQSTKQATILIGNKFPIVFFDPRAGQFQVQYVDIGVKLQVKPVATDDGFVVMDIQPDVSQFVALINNQFPETATRQLNLSVRIKDGGTLVIGGLINESEQTTVAKIPFLGDIPVLGSFFKNISKNRSKNEVVILVTPKVLGN